MCASSGLRLRALLPGHDLFSPTTSASSASLLLSGSLRYFRMLSHAELLMMGKRGTGDESPFIKEMSVAGSRWLAEVALWLDWCFLGTLQAESTCEFVVLEHEQLVKVLRTHTVVLEATLAWCASFRQTLAKGDIDCEVECGVHPSTIIMSLPTGVRNAVSECALAAMGEGLMSRVIMRTADALKKEVQDGECVLVVQATGDFTRT
eukprot:1457553-Amphidinium_carterae.1